MRPDTSEVVYSIVIPTSNHPDLLRRCLGALRRVRPPSMGAGIPLVIYDLAFPVIRQDDFFDIDGIAVCKSSADLVEKTISAQSTPADILDDAAERVTERFGLQDDALERTIAMVEGI